MYIEHIAVWTRDLERLKTFYETWFKAIAGKKYVNPAKQFAAYFLTFPSGARLELMQSPGVLSSRKSTDVPVTGYAHIAIAVGSEKRVDELTADLVREGTLHIDGPRRTGDGYYESVILDPDGNRIEITV